MIICCPISENITLVKEAMKLGHSYHLFMSFYSAGEAYIVGRGKENLDNKSRFLGNINEKKNKSGSP